MRRVFDLRSGEQVRQIDSIGTEVTDIEEHRGSDILTITYGKTMSFWDANTYVYACVPPYACACGITTCFPMPDRAHEDIAPPPPPPPAAGPISFRGRCRALWAPTPCAEAVVHGRNGTSRSKAAKTNHV